MSERPDFKDIKTYNEFKKYYWYREELKQICKKLNIDYIGQKIELNHNIEEYFKGNLIKKTRKAKTNKIVTTEITLNTKLLDCNFSCSQRFREFFSKQTGKNPFKFNTDMVATSKKVKEDNDKDFTLRDMLDVYYGKLVYAKYDKSSCQWNKFLKDFCEDKNNSKFKNKLKVASILWSIVRESTEEKIYTQELVENNYDKIKDI
jgi:hypothetical protein